MAIYLILEQEKLQLEIEKAASLKILLSEA